MMTVPRTLAFVTHQYVRGRRLPVYPEPPAARPTLALAAQVAMDEVVLAVMNNPRRYPRRRDYERVGQEVTDGLALYQARGWLEDPLSFHPEPVPLIDDLEIRVRGARGLAYEHITFASAYHPWEGEPGGDRWLDFELNRTAHAYVLRHPDGAPRPWLVCVHGFGTGHALMDFTGFRAAKLHRELGLNLAFPVVPLHGPRTSNRIGGLELMSFDMLNGVHGLAQSVADVRRVISWVRAQEPSPSVLGVYGISLGGYIASLVAALEPGLDLVITGIPAIDLPALFAHHCPPALRRRALEYGLLGEEVHRLHRVVSPLAVDPLVPRERRFIYAGLGDRMATPKQAYRLWQHWDEPRLAWYGGNHIGFMWSKETDRFVTGSLQSSGFIAA